MTRQVHVKPRLLDLFCGAGGASKGYADAGFEVVGVDIKPQPNYPFELHYADALEFPLDGFDAIHASPPCQAYTHARLIGGRGRSDHPRLIEPVRARLRATGLPYIIENVEGAPLIEATRICGTALGLRVKRHRLFESNVPLMSLPCACGRYRPKRYVSTPRLDGSRPLSAYVNPLASETTHEQFAEALEIDWVPARGRRPARELHEAIPPAYTLLLGEQLMRHLAYEEVA